MLSCFIANEPGPEKRTAQGSSCSTTVCVCFHRPCTNCPCSMPRKGCAFDPQRGVLFHMHPPRLIPIGDDAARLLTILPPRPETSQHTTKTTVVSRPSLFLSLLSSPPLPSLPLRPVFAFPLSAVCELPLFPSLSPLLAPPPPPLSSSCAARLPSSQSVDEDVKNSPTCTHHIFK